MRATKAFEGAFALGIDADLYCDGGLRSSGIEGPRPQASGLRTAHPFPEAWGLRPGASLKE